MELILPTRLLCGTDIFWRSIWILLRWTSEILHTRRLCSRDHQKNGEVDKYLKNLIISGNVNWQRRDDEEWNRSTMIILHVGPGSLILFFLSNVTALSFSITYLQKIISVVMKGTVCPQQIGTSSFVSSNFGYIFPLIKHLHCKC